jgi:hypothetical protein
MEGHRLTHYVALRLPPSLHKDVQKEALEKYLKIPQLIRLILAERYKKSDRDQGVTDVEGDH